MNTVLNTLFGLDGTSPVFGGEDVRFGWAQPIEAWIAVLAIAVLAAAAALAYARLNAPRSPRAVLAGVRILTLTALLAVLSGPQLVRDRTSIERDWAVVLVDRSASMSVTDVTLPDNAAPVSRDAALRAALEGSREMWGTLADTKRVLWLGFDAGVYELDSRASEADPSMPTASIPALAEPTGRRTRLGAALDEALRRTAARPLSGIIVLTDGRSADAPSRATLRRLSAEGIPLFAVPLGSADPIGDTGIAEVEAPAAAFLGDTVPVLVRLDTATTEHPGGTLRLIDQATGQALAETEITPGAADATLEVTTSRPDNDNETVAGGPASDPGTRDWTVVFEPAGRDLIDDNNTAEVRIELVDRPLRVLYIDGYPRWEQRYLKSLLLRERSIDSSSLLLAPARRYQQEGDTEIDRLPITPEEWTDYDVVILGDVRAELFGRDQLSALLRQVGEGGGGLLWIAGPNATPQSWTDTPLDALVPLSSASGEPRPEPWNAAVTLIPAGGADRLGVLNLGTNAFSDPAMGWSRLRWVQRLEPGALKPGVEVLATAATADAFADGEPGLPAVVTMRYASGRVIYVGTDETWRYRFGRGEGLFERFWLPLIRLLARERLARADRPAVLTARPDRAEPQQPVVIELELLDQSLLRAAPDSIVVEIRGRDGSPSELTLQQDTSTPETEPRLIARYASAWVPAAPGTYAVRASDPLLAGLDLTTQIEIIAPDDEMRSPQTDFAALEALATPTGGAILDPGDVSSLVDLLPNRRLLLAGTPETTSLWDKPVVLAALVLLLGIEWAGRRLIRLA